MGRAIQLRIELAEVESITPAAEVQRGRRDLQDRAVAAIEKDGFVREIIEMFDATLVESSRTNHRLQYQPKLHPVEFLRFELSYELIINISL